MEERLQDDNKENCEIIKFVPERNEMTTYIVEQLKKKKKNLIYSNDFLLYENGYWQIIDEMIVKKIIQEFCFENGLDEKYYKHHKKADDLFEQAKLDLFTKIETKRNLLNFRNGTLELNTMLFRDHSMDDFLFYCLPYDYDENAECPKWEAFLKEVLPQDDLQTAIQEAFAYPLSNLHLEKISFLIGNGRNGKSVALGVIGNVLGEDNVSHVTLEQIVKNDGQGVYQMMNKLVNITYESSSNILNSSTFKSYVSGEALNVKKLYDNQFTTTNYPQTIIASNSIPQSSDFSEGFYRRFNNIPFTVTIPKEKVNPNLKEELCEESAGIMNWILEGIKRLKENRKFTYSETVENLQNEFRIESDNVYSFLFENNYVQSETQKILFSALYREFENYCEEYNYKQLGKKNFKQRLMKLKYDIKYYTGNSLFIWIEKKNLEEETTKIIVEVPEKKSDNDSLFDMSMKCPF